MNRRAKPKPAKFLVFLLPVVIVSVLFLVPSKLSAAGDIVFYALAALYPVVSAIVFFKNRVLLWSAPMIYSALTVTAAALTYGSTSVFSMFMATGLSAVALSLVCSFVAFLVRRNQRQNGTLPS